MTKTLRLVLLPLAVVSGLVGDSAQASAQIGNVGIGTTSPQSKLHTVGGVRHDTLAGAGNRLVMADAQGRIFAPIGVPSNATHVAIPDNGCGASNGASSSITVTGMAAPVSSANIKVRLDISHTLNVELIVWLISPVGDTLNLLFTNGGVGNGFSNTIFWDGASGFVPSSSGPAITGTYKPSGFMGAYCGMDADVGSFGAMGGGSIVPNGTWTLRLYDAAGFDVGNLNSWNISFEEGDPAVPTAGFTNNALLKGGQGTVKNSSIYEVNGNLGIGTSTPAVKLHAISSASTTAYFNSTAGDPDGVVQINVPANNTSCANCSEFIQFLEAGSMLGSISANLISNTVSYNTTSDRRLKENISDTRFGLQDLMKIQVKDYNFKGADKTARVTGVMAQDLFIIYPDAVKSGDEGEKVKNAWGVDYGKLTPLLIKAVQEQQAQIEALKNENAELRKKERDYAELAVQVKEMQQMLGVEPKTVGSKVGSR
jgi:subtilisin-like proprotein convertase family protein